MRKELRHRIGRRGRFQATFERFGVKRSWTGGPDVKTALFVDIKDESGQIVADHIWFTVGKRIAALALKRGDEMFFVARVTKYYKRNPEFTYDEDAPRHVADYRLSYPSEVRKMGALAAAAMPLFAEK